YTVAGKTGTARKPQPGGGYFDAAGHIQYEATFAGFVPAEDPQLSVIVVLDEPSATIYASGATAPVFSQIAAYSLRRFHVPPPGYTLAPTVPAPTHVTAASAQAAEVIATSTTTTSTTVPSKSTTTTT